MSCAIVGPLVGDTGVVVPKPARGSPSPGRPGRLVGAGGRPGSMLSCLQTSLSWFCCFLHSCWSLSSSEGVARTFWQALLDRSPLLRHFATLPRNTVGSMIVGRFVGRVGTPVLVPWPVRSTSSSADRLV